MGQTLTHGIYLPDEGERNCYNGLAGNWSILDGAVGTIAEHTTQIAGKAPLVHTHTKSQITDFPAYGTTAGTICEGNDSRLSDARTPVAHTHTKSDVTDLFNSGNTWTGTNNFSIGNLNIQTEYALGTLPQAESAVALFTGRTTDNNFVTNINFYQNPTRGTGLRFTVRNKWDNDGYSTTGTTRNAHLEFLQNIDKTAYLQWQGYVNNSLYPLANNTYDLGTSTNKWKSLNGTNPGALSLPNLSRKSSILEYITDLTGGLQYYTPLADGWICIQADNSSATNYIRCAYDDILVKANGNGQAQGLSVLIPVLAGVQIGIRVVCTTLSSAYFYHCQGNVT